MVYYQFIKAGQNKITLQLQVTYSFHKVQYHIKLNTSQFSVQPILILLLFCECTNTLHVAHYTFYISSHIVYVYSAYIKSS